MYRQKSANKYHAESVFYNGHKFDSKAECGYGMDLDLRQKAGEIRSWEPHVRLDLRVNGKHCDFFKIDFVVTHLDGHLELVEVKGVSLPGFRTKWRLLESVHDELWPGSEMTLVKVYGNRGKSRWGAGDVRRAVARVGRTQ